MKKILVLYAKSGFLGHKVIADNYASLLKQNGYEVVEGDVFAIDNRAVVKGGEKIYFWWMQKAPWFWRFLYDYWTYIPLANWFKNYFLPRRYPKSTKFILEQKPDLIITTHPVATAIVNRLKSKKLYTGPLLTTFSDWHTQKFHVFKNVDKYLVVTPEEKTEMQSLGFGDERVVISGMLLDNNYYQAPGKEEARRRLGLPQDKKIILLMGGGRAWQIENTIKALSQIAAPAHVIVVGGSAERKAELEKFLNQILKTNGQTLVTFTVTGFIEPSLYFAAADLLISKPGGLTTSQAFLLKLPMLIISPLPGQEDKNVKYLLAKHAIILAEKDNLASQINSLLTNEQKLNQIAQNAYTISPHKARDIILEEVKKALYSNSAKH